MADLTLRDILEFGSTGVYLFIMWMLWRRLTEVTDLWMLELKAARAEREAIAKREEAHEEREEREKAADDKKTAPGNGAVVIRE